MPDVPAANASLTPQPGTLYVVATPIGNLADFTDRARAILGAVDLVACEDTRTTGAMLTRLGLRRELTPYHEHNEIEVAERLAQGPKEALHHTKHALNHWYRSFLPHFELSLALEFLGFSGKELEEGLKALKEKRPPEFP